MQPLWYTESQTDPQQGAWSVYLRMKPTGCPRQNTHFTCRMWSHHCAVSAVVVLIVAVLSWQEINETFSVWLKRDRGELFFSLSSWIAKYLGAALYVKFKKKKRHFRKFWSDVFILFSFITLIPGGYCSTPEASLWKIQSLTDYCRHTHIFFSPQFPRIKGKSNISSEIIKWRGERGILWNGPYYQSKRH